MRTCYITFFAPIQPVSTYNLIELVTFAQRKPGLYTHLGLTVASPGGQMTYAFAAYGHIRQSHFEIHTHALGSVISAGVLLYCLGKKRSATPLTNFQFHPVSLPVSNTVFEIPTLKEQLKRLETDQKNMIRILAETTGKSEKEIENDVQNRIVLNAEAAKEYGLVTDIFDVPFVPTGAESHHIGEFMSPIHTLNPLATPAHHFNGFPPVMEFPPQNQQQFASSCFDYPPVGTVKN